MAKRGTWETSCRVFIYHNCAAEIHSAMHNAHYSISPWLVTLFTSLRYIQVMVHLHYFITAGRMVDETSRLYHVSIGTSAQANRDFLFLTAFAVSHGYYFEVRSRRSSDFVKRLIESRVFPESNVQAIAARELVRHLKADTSAPIVACSSQHHQRNFLDSNYRFFSNLNNRGNL